MKISKKVGRMALECVEEPWWLSLPELLDTFQSLGWMCTKADVFNLGEASEHSDLLMCWIATLAGVKHD